MVDVDELLRIAEEIFEEGYTHSEAYPALRWRKNGWPEVTDRAAFKLMDAHILLRRSIAAYRGVLK